MTADKIRLWWANKHRDLVLTFLAIVAMILVGAFFVYMTGS
jgi:hypothetical protein